jgi:hypothetical protein
MKTLGRALGGALVALLSCLCIIALAVIGGELGRWVGRTDYLYSIYLRNDDLFAWAGAVVAILVAFGAIIGTGVQIKE